jgi:hypothetical protein
MTQVTAGGRAVEQAEKEDLRVLIEAAANQRFPGAVRAVMVLEYGDEQHVKPGRIMIRVVISPAGPDGQERPLLAFMQAHRPEMRQFRRDLEQRFPRAHRVEFTMASRPDPKDARVITMPLRP